jgi:hypothetical protein
MSNFPNFDFKIDCGDDPRVRQWLHENGKYWQSGDLLILSALERSRLYVEGETVSATISKSFFDRNPLPLINPFDYIQSELTIAERMAELIEEYRTNIPKWARWVAVDEEGFCAFRDRPTYDKYSCAFETESDYETVDFTFKDEFLFSNWRETLTEIKPVAIEQDRGTIDSNDEMINDDSYSARSESCAEFMYRAKVGAGIFSATPERLLTIPSTLPTEQAMPMMLGGDFGGQHESN